MSRSRPRLALLVGAVAVLVAGVVTAVVGVSGPGGPGPGPGGGRPYLALGDSVAFGYRPAGMVPAPDYHDQGSFVGYPELVGRALGLTVTNASCPGETVASMISATGPSNGCENTDGTGGGYRTDFPLHVAYQGTQLAYALAFLSSHPRTALVTIGIGLNDIAVCHAVTADGCASAAEQRSLLAEIGNGLIRIFSAIRNDGYRGRIVAVTYYSQNYEVAGDVGVTRDLDTLLATVAGRYGALVADGFGAFERASASHHGNVCAARLIIRLPSGGCDEHPTLAGQELLAGAVEEALRA